MKKKGEILMKYINKFMNKTQSLKPQYKFDKKITNFYVNADGFYRYHEIGKNYLCPTQMFNHIPGHTALIRKDAILQNIQ